MSNDFATLLAVAIDQHGGERAFLDGETGDSFTYEDVGRGICDFQQNLLSRGFTPGLHVGLHGANSVDWMIAHAAIAMLGGVALMLNPYLVRAEIDQLISAGSVDLLVTDAPAGRVDCEEVQLQRGRLASDPSVPTSRMRVDPGVYERVMFTSGTTGIPKGILCPGRVIGGSIESALRYQLATIDHASSLLISTPLTHIANFFAWSFFVAGKPTIITSRFRPERFFDQISEHYVSHAVVVPTMIHMLTQLAVERHRVVNSPLRALWYAGSPIPPQVAADAIDAFPGILNQQYGFSELLGAFPGMAVSWLQPEDHSVAPNSCGRPIPNAQIRLLRDDGLEAATGEIGELCVDAQEPGEYVQTVEDPAYVDGMIKSGDFAYRDSEGFIYLVGRRSEMIISGGFNIYPNEIERSIESYPGIVQASVVGIPHPKWVERPVAAVVLAPGKDFDANAVQSHVREQLAHFKVPDVIRQVEALPANSTGKVLRREVRRIVFDDLVDQGGI